MVVVAFLSSRRYPRCPKAPALSPWNAWSPLLGASPVLIVSQPHFLAAVFLSLSVTRTALVGQRLAS